LVAIVVFILITIFSSKIPPISYENSKISSGILIGSVIIGVISFLVMVLTLALKIFHTGNTLMKNHQKNFLNFFFH